MKGGLDLNDVYCPYCGREIKTTGIYFIKPSGDPFSGGINWVCRHCGEEGLIFFDATFWSFKVIGLGSDMKAHYDLPEKPAKKRASSKSTKAPAKKKTTATRKAPSKRAASTTGRTAKNTAAKRRTTGARR